MSLNNLRSVIAQVTRGGKSVMCRRNFSTGSRYLSTRYRRNLSLSRSSYESGGLDRSELFGSSAKFGFIVFVTWELVQGLEYCRTTQIYLNELAGEKSKAPLLGCLGNILRYVISGEYDD